MGKSIVRKKSIDIKGTLSVSNTGEVFIECEDYDEPLALADLIKPFDSREVAISVKEAIDGV
jgi:hypothetical protein